MIIGTRKKPKHHCPDCDAVVDISMPEAMRYIFLLQPFQCKSCNTDFETSSLGKLVLLAMSSMVVILALNMKTLREIQATEPYFKLYLMAGTLTVTLVFAFILSKRRAFVTRHTQNGGKFMLHFTTLIAMPGSLLLFLYMAKLYGD